jgi:hypothetical protein
VSTSAGLRACVVPLTLLASLGCGDDADAPPDRGQIPAFVRQFFDDARDHDAEAICSVLTADGRAWATGRTFNVREGVSLADASPKRPASLDECVESGAPHATVSSDLPGAMKNGYRPRVIAIRTADAQVRVRIKFAGAKRTWVLSKGADGWLVDYFSMPVRE